MTSHFISGLSGNDFSPIIKARYQRDLAAAHPIQTQVKTNTDKQAKYTQLADLLGKLQNASQALISNGFDTRSVSATSHGAIAADKMIKVTADQTAAFGKVSVKVLQLASSHGIASSSHGAKDTALGIEGTIRLAAGSAAGAEIRITKTMSLNDVASAVNATSNRTGVSANVIKVADNAFKLVLSADKSNRTIAVSDVSGTASRGLGLVDADGKWSRELSPAKPAVMEINGLRVERDGNTIKDALPGLSFNLLRADPTNDLSVDVAADTGGIKTEVGKFVDAYNKLRQFVLSQQKTIDGAGAAPGAALFGESILKNVMSGIYDQMNVGHTHKGRTLDLRSLGVSFTKDNNLKLDDAVLEKALSADFEAVKGFFAGETGLVGRMRTAMKQWSGDDSGVIDKELKQLKQQIAEGRSDISEISRQAQENRQELIRYYARLEQKIAASNLIIQQLEAMNKANRGNS